MFISGCKFIILAVNTVAEIKRSWKIQMPLFELFEHFSHYHTVGQAYRCDVQASAYFKISTVTTTAWCHPTSTVAGKAANTAVCEHRLTPRGSAAPPRSAPSARSGDRPCSPYSPLALVPVSGTSVWAVRPQYDTDPPPLKPVSPQPRSQSWILLTLPDWMFVFEREPSNVSFHSRTVVTGIQWVAEDGFVDHEGCSGLISFF